MECVARSPVRGWRAARDEPVTEMFSFVPYRNVGLKDTCFPGPAVSPLGYINPASNGTNGKLRKVDGSTRLSGKGRGPLHHAQPQRTTLHQVTTGSTAWRPIVIRRVGKFNPQSPMARTSVGPEKDRVGPKAVRQVRLLFPTHAVENACRLGDDGKALTGASAPQLARTFQLSEGLVRRPGEVRAMPRYKKKVCRVWPDLRAERQGRGLVPAPLLHAGLRKRREGKALGEPPDPVNDDAVREPRVLEVLAQVLGEASPQEIAAAENEEAEETGVMAIEVTADRALIARTRPGEEGRAEVEWGGSFDHRRGSRDGEIVKLLEPGCERRVRAREQTIERDEGEVDGLKLWMELRGSGLNPSRTTGRRPRHSGR